jgi:hypothetical protein
MSVMRSEASRWTCVLFFGGCNPSKPGEMRMRYLNMMYSRTIVITIMGIHGRATLKTIPQTAWRMRFSVGRYASSIAAGEASFIVVTLCIGRTTGSGASLLSILAMRWPQILRDCSVSDVVGGRMSRKDALLYLGIGGHQRSRTRFLSRKRRLLVHGEAPYELGKALYA